MFRMLLITMLIGLTMAAYSHHQTGPYRPQQAQPQQQQHLQHRQPIKQTHQITALDQLIKKKPAVHFLGRGFVQKALYNQGENKFIRLNGKEERDVNGTIQINKQNVYIDVSESKNGHFLMENQKKKILGRVDMHSGSNKHLAVHTAPTGEQFINGYQTGNAQLNVEQDLASKNPVGSKLAQNGPKKHMRMRIVQNHSTFGNVAITNDKPQFQHYRYRRQAETPVNTNCRELNCLFKTQDSKLSLKF